MKYILILLLLSLSVNAQTKRIFYELEYNSSSDSESVEKKYVVLDININDTKYYDNSFLEKDSLNKVYNSQNTNWTEIIPIVRKKNSNINLNFVEIGDHIYTYETNDVLKWELTNETQNIDKFTAQKAKLNFGGRNWTAWFTKDIPLNEGPYKFHGLPGLILKLTDDENNFQFQLVKIQNLPETYDTKNFLEIRYGDKPIKTTEKMAFQKAKDYFADPLNDYRQGLNSGKITSFEYYGKKYEAKDLSLLTKQEQDYILEEYNPIELDKAFYPIKPRNK